MKRNAMGILLLLLSCFLLNNLLLAFDAAIQPCETSDFSVVVYSPTKYVVPDQDSKHIVVVIASYNNALYYKTNLDSIFSQEYDNFEVIITDDNSPDDTGKLIEDYLAVIELPCKVTFIKNHVRRGALQNTYRPISWIKNEHVVACVDGDDALAHSDVLSLINKTYANPDVWMTHGCLQLWNGASWDYQEPIPAHVIRTQSFRSYPRIISHLRTFYAGLFRHIKLKDLLYEGAFLGAAPDVAWTIPIMEMSGFHHKYIKTITYRYNDDTPLNEFRVSRDLQLGLERFIRSKKQYLPLENLDFDSKQEQLSVDLVVYQNQAGDTIEQAVTKALQAMQPVTRLFVVVKDTVSDYDQMCENLKKQYPGIEIFCFSETHIKEKFIRHLCLQETDNAFVVFVPSSCSLDAKVDLKLSIQKLRNTQAYGFYFNKIQKKLPQKYYIDVDGTTYAHEFAHALHQGIRVTDFTVALYPKKNIADICKTTSYDSVEQLQNQLILLCDQSQVGLFNR